MRTKTDPNDPRTFLKRQIREIPDFPQKGVLFRDITTLLKQPEALRLAVDILYEHFKDKGFTKVVGIESRGFMLGGILADRLGAGFVPIRKKGKLPSGKISRTFQLEYGSDVIEMHVDALSPDDKVLLHDDLLATGGTTLAALDLIKSTGVREVAV
ncbi:MAG: adenine phosphoribosyltransferase, partial [Bacteroidales bacterium]|nr:adenine phosphoribosyltransferase [Bacteroidales bacterium]